MTDKKQKIQKEIIMVPADTDGVKCDGGGGPLGHPQVWYTFDKRPEAHCHYCGRQFIKQGEAASH